MEKKPELLLRASCIVGEGPLWDDRRERLYFLDIRGKRVYRMALGDAAPEEIPLPQQIGCMALKENGDLLLALEDGVYARDDKTGALSLAHAPCPVKGRRFNDGKIGPDGRFYLGTTDEDGNGAFYCLHQGRLRELFGGARCANGVDWTADEKTMYYIDSPRRMIERFDFSAGADAPLRNRRRCWDASFLGSESVQPDGMCIDAEGMLWVAVWGGYCALRVNPRTGEILQRAEVPAARVSCCAFAGKGLNQLILTTASYQAEPEREPLAGSVFLLETQVPGLPVHRYKE